MSDDDRDEFPLGVHPILWLLFAMLFLGMCAGQDRVRDEMYVPSGCRFVGY